ncbi:MAG: FAD-dependent oxidoreductase [Gammaproteobacteria bacterium]|nr:FAD-dependent oxidoreductase [Gammaproteobacteria bacterium]
MNRTRLLVVSVIVVLVAAFFFLDVGQYLNMETLKARQDEIDAYYRDNPARTIAIYFIAYVVMAALSLPGAVWITLAGGAIFGLWTGTLIISFASTIGATLAFLVARFLLYDWVQNRFGRSLRAVNEGVRRDGAFYLFTLRMVPLFPFWVINLVMALTPIKTWVFYLVSQVGMLAGTLVYVNAGAQIAQIRSLDGVLSPSLLISLSLLGVFPLAARRIIDVINRKKVYREYTRPEKFDRNLVVIGAGSSGLVSAYIAAAVKADVSLVEKHRMGGDCLNTGCVPSKTLIRSAKFVSHVHRAAEFGMKSASVEFDFADVMDRVHQVIRTIEPNDSVERYTKLGVDCIQGEATIRSPFEVEVNGRTLTTRSIIIAAGARPLVPPIPGLEDVDYWTSDTLWNMRRLPERLVVLGGGPIGCELTQCFARLGSRVTQVEMMPQIMGREDPEVAQLVLDRFTAEGVDVRLSHKAVRVEPGDAGHVLVCEHEGAEVRIGFDEILVALGRKANVTGYGLEELGIETTPSGTIRVNEFLQTRFPNIYAVGDVAGPYQFTHTGAHQAWFATVNALFGAFRKFRVDYSVIPWATFTEPEVARVGLSETEAREQGVHFEVTRYDIGDLDRAIADQEAHGFVKVLTVPGKDRILGATIVGEHAGDLIAEYVTAMRHKLGMNKILGTIHIYPTLTEANKFAAGEWKRAHAPQGVLKWLDRFHRWMRR